jgi:acetyl-CoA carboxylase carboxyl transferase subunit alpha
MQAADTLRSALIEQLAELRQLSEAELLQQRYDKFRRMGRVLAAGATDSTVGS